ncbi:hypothetical protein M951_chr3191 (nucleomorph) [Lotharella oceanica]|uniref:Ankyrin repeat protein n=1 Tax=Lotharella oceanica TaxID=641309 RepID=A0A060DAN0_9EUKA|nr:hypothetical protein M951_chr114 [Lotharella oceanica]AIB09696.1 hypothetical protein M951_chr1217 [Lotharella oceanica]AIB09717.1 hypothetical protein M951_chr214 [Lotharella oceanica]AIB09899.1 hypothetical protein M951_chr2207 [Lotharella oceanica]AIB09920.1 hypothetical protein M951_chr314 [Lotharella oceanica]
MNVKFQLTSEDDAKILSLLIDANANINEKVGHFPIDRDFPLVLATNNLKFRREMISRVLINKKANIEVVHEDGKKPINFAIENMLLKKQSLSEITGDPTNWGIIFVWNGESTPELLIEKANLTGIIHPPLHSLRHAHWAFTEEMYKVAEMLIDNKADIEARDSAGKTLIFVAVEKDRPGLLFLLLNNGANTEVKDSERHPLLHIRDEEEIDNHAREGRSSKRILRFARMRFVSLMSAPETVCTCRMK